MVGMAAGRRAHTNAICMPLTDAQARAARPREGKLTKFSDGQGLQLWAHPSGARSWHLALRVAGRQKSVTLGPYPALSLKEARRAAQAARERLLASAGDVEGGDAPGASAALFGAVKAEWLESIERSGAALATRQKAIWLASLAAPLDARPIAEIRAPDLLALLRPIEAAGHLETARRLRAALSRIFRQAAAAGLVEADPTALLRGAIAAPRPVHRAAVVDREGFAQILRAIEAYRGRGGGQGGGIVRDALLLLALTAARPGELRLAQWGEFDLAAGVWTVPAGRMKMRQPHRAPLARQALDILHKLKGEDGQTRPPSPFVFPGQRPGRPLSENALNVALRAMGVASADMSAHGFRSSFSTLANESGLWAYDAIERALAHQDASEVRRAYHRADYWEERRRLMQWWADEVAGMANLEPAAR
jgi:integrase